MPARRCGICWCTRWARSRRMGSFPAVPTNVPIERAKRAEHGDFASNVALAIAKGAGKPPRAVAEAIVARLQTGADSPLAEATIAGPGFINLRLSPAFWQRMLPAILAAGDDWGRGAARATPKIVLEYLSANPTGPITVAHGRHAAVGDSMTRLLRFAGYAVTPEYYINDAGNQVEMLTLSVWTRYMETARAADPSVPEVVFPENGYKGDYIRGFGRDLYARDGKRWIGNRAAGRRPADQAVRDGARARDDPRDAGAVRRRVRGLAERAGAARRRRCRRDAARAGREGLHRSPRRRRLAEDDRAVGRRQGPRRRQVGRAAHVSAGGHRVPPQEAGARLRRALRHLGLRPPRPHRAHAGGAEGVRLRPGGAARDPDPERQPAAGRGRGEDGQAGGRVRHARRRGRRGGARRDPLLLPDAPERHAAGVRPGGRQAAVDGQPGLLRPVRPRALRGDQAPGGGAGGAAAAAGSVAGRRAGAAGGDRDPAPAGRLPGLRGRRGRRARAPPRDDLPDRAGGRVPELLHPPAEGARRHHPAPGAAPDG